MALIVFKMYKYVPLIGGDIVKVTYGKDTIKSTVTVI